MSALTEVLAAESVDYEIVVVDDGSHDATGEIVSAMAEHNPRVICRRSPYTSGFGFAIRAGLDVYTGDAVAIVMADLSDDPWDVVGYLRLLERGFDCAFGSRFLPGSKVVDYPKHKLLLNRLVNWGIRLLFRHGYNDTTNAFKAYRREVIDAAQPLLAQHFNITVELPLKAIVRGYSYAVVPISWRNRQAGTSKLRLQEMGSRYLFITLFVFLEHLLSRGDYRRPGATIRWRRPTRPNELSVDAEDREQATAATSKLPAP